MRRKILSSSACLLLAGAGLLGYHRQAAPAPPGAAASKTAALAASGPPPEAPVSQLADDGIDHVSEAASARPGEHFPHTPTGRLLDQHLKILVDVNPGADDRRERSLAELRTHAKEASQDLLDAYHAADPADTFGRWLISSTLGELAVTEAYAGLVEIADSPVPPGLVDTDGAGSALANESAIRQNAADGLIALARAGNAAAERDLLHLALDPPSGDDAVRTLAIKGYLAAGTDYDARVQRLVAQLPARYHDVVTLTVTQPEPASPPEPRTAHTKNG